MRGEAREALGMNPSSSGTAKRALTPGEKIAINAYLTAVFLGNGWQEYLYLLSKHNAYRERIQDGPDGDGNGTPELRDLLPPVVTNAPAPRPAAQDAQHAVAKRK